MSSSTSTPTPTFGENMIGKKPAPQNEGQAEDNSSINSDEALLQSFGYQQTLHRTWHQFENFVASFGALNFVGGIRNLFATGLYAGGPLAAWSSYLVTIVMMGITAASIAEICSAVPLSGSIYIWAAESAGPVYGRTVGFVVGFWSTTAWTSFVASNSQATANYLLSEAAVFGDYFPGGITTENVKFRAVQWIVSELLLAVVCLITCLHPKTYTWIFRASFFIILLDFVLVLIWLPIGTSKLPEGFQNSDFFLSTYQGTGAPPAWNWCLSFLYTTGIMTGFDASGHIAEETKDASRTAARGIFWSCIATGMGGLPILMLFLACSPPLEQLFALDAPQPFVLLYARALGRGGGVVMTVIAALGLLINTSIAVVAASRLVYAVARDGVLPGSKWIGKVDEDGSPRNAVYFIWAVSGVLLCTILPSSVAFTSLVSCAGVPTIAAYAVIPFCRLVFTRDRFHRAKWTTGIFSKPFLIIAFLWNTFTMAVLLSPYEFPVASDLKNFNFAPIIFGAITIFGFLAAYITPEDRWLSGRTVERVLDASDRVDYKQQPNQPNKRDVDDDNRVNEEEDHSFKG